MSSILSVDDLGAEGFDALLARAAALAGGARAHERRGVALLAFFQASTRTRLGFARAAVDLGAAPLDLSGARHTAVMSAPESLGDTLRAVAGIADVVVLRHPDADEAGRAVRGLDRPVVNAGLGDVEHPSQALVDLHAVATLRGGARRLRWGLVGDLAGSRSAHSLLRALRWYDPVEVRLLGPSRPDGWTDGLAVSEADPDALAGLDVLYVAGLPAGSAWGDPTTRARCRLDAARMARLPERALVLCPLPRVDEIDVAVDADPRAAWFRQADLGRWARLALLEHAWG